MNESFIAQSMSISANQKLSNILLVMFTVTGIIMSCTQMMVMCSWKPLRTIDQILIFFVAASDFLKTVSVTVLGSEKEYLASNGMYEARSQVECLTMTLPTAVTSHIILVSMLMISLDRLIALGLPVWYTQNKRNIKIFFVLASAFLGVGYGSLQMIGGRPDVYQLICSVVNAPSASTRKMFDYTDNLCCGLVLVINVTSCSIVYWRLGKAMRANENMRLAKKHIQLNAVKTLVAVMVLFLFSVYGNMASTTLLANLPLSDADKGNYSNVGNYMCISRSILDFPIYIIMCKEYKIGFREIFIKKIFRCADNKKNTVAPTGSVITSRIAPLTTYAE